MKKCLILLSIFSLVNCSEKSDPEAKIITEPQIYVAGSGTSQTGREYPLYWKNGDPSTPNSNLSSSESSFITAFTTFEDVEHYVGSSYIPRNGDVPTYWKNGQAYRLPSPSGRNYIRLTKIFVDKNNTLITGTSYLNIPCESGSFYTASYAVLWDNLDPTFLTTGDTYSEANSVFSIENDVYVVGGIISQPCESWSTKAVYWKNGELIYLEDGNEYSNALSIYVTSNSDVYIAGTVNHLPVYWKNGKRVRLLTSTSSGVANDIIVNNEDVYVSGNDGNVLVYWKNGNQIRLRPGYTSTIRVEANEVYVLGITTPTITHDPLSVALWKEGVDITPMNVLQHKIYNESWNNVHLTFTTKPK